MATATVESDEDDLWDFTTPGGLAPVELSSGGDTSDDGTSLLPASKRRKLQKQVHLPDLVPLAEDSDAESRDSDIEIIEEMKKVNEKKKKEQERIQFPEACSISIAPRRKESDRHMAAKAQSMRNRAILEGLKADLEAPTPEPAEARDEERRRLRGEDETQAEDRGEGGQAVDLDRLVVKIKGRGMEEPVKLRIGKKRPLSVLFEKFREWAEQKALIDEGVPLKFMFDGDRIEDDNTCEELEIEEDCVIEAYW